MSQIVSQPDVTVNILAAAVAVGNTPQRVLAIGSQISGSAVSGELQLNIGNDSTEDTLFGARSMVAGMIRRFKTINRVTQIDAIGLEDNGSGVAATGDVTFSGTATEDGVLNITIGSRKDFVFELPVSETDAFGTIATNLTALITANTNVPVTAAATLGAVDLTAANDGTEGNFIGIEVTGAVAGVTFAIGSMTGGALNPVLTTLFDVIQDRRYQTFIWAGTWDTDTIKDFLDGRFNVSNDVLDGVAVMSQTDTLANHIATLTAINSQSLAIHANSTESVTDVYEGSAEFEIDTVIAAEVAAVRSLRLTDGANISRFIVSRSGALDNTGGAAIASLPYFNTPMIGFSLIDPDKGFSTEEIEQLTAVGGFVVGNNDAGNAVILGELVTTYKTDAAGNPDPTYKFLNLVDTASNSREYIYNNLKSTYSQSRLTEGDLIPGRAMANEASIRGTLVGLYTDLSGTDFVLTQAGEDALQFYKTNLNVTLDLVDGTVTFTSLVPFVTQLRTIVGSMQVSFSVEG